MGILRKRISRSYYIAGQDRQGRRTTVEALLCWEGPRGILSSGPARFETFINDNLANLSAVSNRCGHSAFGEITQLAETMWIEWTVHWPDLEGVMPPGNKNLHAWLWFSDPFLLAPNGGPRYGSPYACDEHRQELTSERIDVIFRNGRGFVLPEMQE